MKFHNIKLRAFANRQIILKFFRALTLPRLINFLGIVMAAERLTDRTRFAPYAATIEPSRMCNLRCVLCPAAQIGVDFESIYLDLKIFKKFVDDNKQLFFLFFTGNGEPLLNKDLPEMIDYAKKKRIITILSTNATVEIAKMIKPDFIIFSLDYINKDDYLRDKGRDRFEMCKKNISEYNRTKDKETVTFLQFFIHKYDKPVLTNFKNFAKSLGSDFVFLKRPAIYSKEFEIKEKKNCLAFDGVDSKKKCKYIYFQTYLTAEGLISACCNDLDRKLSAGDLHQDSFKKIWKSKEYETIRSMNNKKLLMAACASCPKMHRVSPVYKIISNKK
jgi:radical SAM protein with 4Fe4S-binding SPASM domain